MTNDNKQQFANPDCKICEGSGIDERVQFYDDGSMSRTVEHWPCVCTEQQAATAAEIKCSVCNRQGHAWCGSVKNDADREAVERFSNAPIASTPPADELLPCPFCGGPAVNVAAKYIQCGAPYNMNGDCPGLKIRATPENWNTRTQPSADKLQGLVEVLNNALCGYELLIQKYPDPNVIHVDYRVNAARIAEEAANDIRQALSTLDQPPAPQGDAE